jgi:hypothetical protein
LATRRRDAAATLFLIALILIVFSDVLFFGRQFYFRDVTRFYYPSKKLLRQIIGSGEFPSWNPFWASGQPLAANPDYATFYPVQWLTLLPGFDFWFRLHVVLHFCIAAAGAYFLLRRWTAHRESAIFGAMVFSLGGLMLSLTNLLPILYCVAWLPWILLATDLLIEAFSWKRFAAAALLLSLPMFGGDPVTVAQTFLFPLALAAARRSSWRMLARVIAAEVIAGVVAAVQIVPAADLLRDSVRWRGFPFSVVAQWSTPPVRLLELFIPQLTGPGAEHFRLYWGTAKYGWLDPFYVGIYFGVIAVAFALAGLSVRMPGTLAVLAALATSVVLSLGRHTPVLRLLYDGNLFSSFRYPEKFLILGIVPLTLFSAIAFDRAMAGDRRIIRRALLVAAVTGVFSLVLVGASFHPSYRPQFIAFWDISVHPLAGRMAELSRSVWLRAVCSSLAAAGVLWYATRARSVKWAKAAMVVTVLDLGYQRISTAETVNGEFFRTPPQVVQRIDRRVRIFHQADWYPATFVARHYFDLPEMYWVLRNGLYPMAGAAWGVATAMNRDIDETFLTPATDFNIAMNELRRRNAPQWFEPLMAMSAAGYRAMYLPFEQQVARAGSDRRSIEPIIFVPTRTNSMFYFADRIVRSRSREEFVRQLSSGGTPPRTAFVDLAPFAPPAARVLAIRPRSNSMEVDVEATGTALLVCSITRHKYWSATMDQRDARLFPVNLQYQGLLVPAGRHTIRMQYRNPLLIAGGAISLVSAALLSLLLLGVGPLAESGRPGRVAEIE